MEKSQWVHVMHAPTRSIHVWPQNLDLAQIEAIVQEIEQEKEAGKAEQASDILDHAHS